MPKDSRTIHSWPARTYRTQRVIQSIGLGYQLCGGGAEHIFILFAATIFCMIGV
ncbi:hypothetical protein SCHPADRAFT_908000 [Schizopora paradoxa]|uniref:Uncharacterized protein n=1 Tax=Schizopora paradoxa TaxID=27342 RepID=A0A0H2RBG5_9AGAM|nr:hypothetical protein SCHPADRAFT_908000 [Schizopora paradoxa]